MQIAQKPTYIQEHLLSKTTRTRDDSSLESFALNEARESPESLFKCIKPTFRMIQSEDDLPNGVVVDGLATLGNHLSLNSNKEL